MDNDRRMPFVKLDGHTKGVYSCDWSAQHRIVVSGGADKTVCLFNPFSGKKQATLEGHRAGVSDVMVNDKDHQIISVEGLGKVCMPLSVQEPCLLPSVRLAIMLHSPGQ